MSPYNYLHFVPPMTSTMDVNEYEAKNREYINFLRDAQDNFDYFDSIKDKLTLEEVQKIYSSVFKPQFDDRIPELYKNKINEIEKEFYRLRDDYLNKRDTNKYEETINKLNNQYMEKIAELKSYASIPQVNAQIMNVEKRNNELNGLNDYSKIIQGKVEIIAYLDKANDFIKSSIEKNQNNNLERENAIDNQNTYDSRTMPGTSDPELIQIYQKLANGEKLNLRESVKLPGHDHPVKVLGDYECKPNCCYRAVSQETYELYKQTGFIQDLRNNAQDNYIEVKEDGSYYTNNAGIDWYLGGVGLRYGDIIIECPASKEYFEPAYDNGTRLSADPTVRHMKSSPKRNPIPMSMVTNVFDLKNIKQNNLRNFEEQRKMDMERRKQQTFQGYTAEEIDQMLYGSLDNSNDIGGMHI